MDDKIKTIQDAQRFVKEATTRNGWKDTPNIDKFDHLHEELIEMSKHLRYKTEEERISYIKNNKDIFTDGIGDLFFALCRLANQLDVNVEDAFEMAKGEFLKKYDKKASEAKPK